MKNFAEGNSTTNGQLVVRPAGPTNLVEQLFFHLKPNMTYILALSHGAPYSVDYIINSFTIDQNGKYLGQSTGLVKATTDFPTETYKQVVLIEKGSW